ncbi:HAD-IA family hydrolase [Deinococcus murrayi]|uniref:HAD-IA family hydrolase n=1 Tax=Deinococcus murrayi TaxID=68910 RepID=UPI0004833267|nr:HAD-IA family hydrolase [Deinococcus murrayi]
MVTPDDRPQVPLRGVLFDRDDTLARTDRGVYREAAAWAAARFGLEAGEAGRRMAATWAAHAEGWWHLRSEEDEAAFWEGYRAELGRTLGLTDAQAGELLAAYPYERFMKPVEDARLVLETLRAWGLKVGVLSNTLPSIGRTLDALGLADLVDVAIATCTVGVHKPEPGAFSFALDALGLEAAEVLFVDDRPENVAAARALGLRAALIDLEGREPGALHRLSDVLGLVQASVEG